MQVKDVALASLTAVEGAHFFSAFNPSIFTIHKFVNDKEGVSKIRNGYVVSTILTITLAVIISAIVESALPFVFAIFVIIALVSVYEAAIRGMV